MNEKFYKIGQKVVTGIDFSSTRRLKKSLDDIVMLQMRYEYAGDIGPQRRALDEYEGLLNLIEMRHAEDDFHIYMKFRLISDSNLKNDGIHQGVLKVRNRIINDMMEIGKIKAHRVFSYE